MLPIKIAIWACSLVSLSCGIAGVPTIATIQTAYEQEASEANSLHDKGLKVLEAKCDDSVGDRFLCQVTFLSISDPKERLYFDIVAVARTGHGWELKSGLCKR